MLELLCEGGLMAPIPNRTGTWGVSDQTGAPNLDGWAVAVDNGRTAQRVPVRVACVSASTRRQATAPDTRHLICRPALREGADVDRAADRTASFRAYRR